MDMQALRGQTVWIQPCWKDDVEGLIAVYEAMVSTPGMSTMLFKTAGPQVGHAYLHHLLVSPVIVLQGLVY